MNKKQIEAIFHRNGIACNFIKVPSRECGVDIRIARDPKYRNGNRVEILKNGKWYILGWLWDIENLSEEQLTAKIASTGEAI